MAGSMVLVRHDRPPRWGGGADGGIGRVVIDLTADAANGSFPATALSALLDASGRTGDVRFQGTLLAIQTNPGTTAPTDDYDITLVDADGVDRLDGAGLNRDATASERATITGAPWVVFTEDLTLTVANNSVNSATIRVTLYYTPSVNTAPGFHQALSSLVDSIAATISPSASVGDSRYSTNDAQSTKVVVAAAPCTVGAIVFSNNGSGKRYLKMYDKLTANVTVGTTAPDVIITLPYATEGVTGVIPLPRGLKFTTGLVIAVVTDFAEDGSPGAPTANDVQLVIAYT